MIETWRKPGNRQNSRWRRQQIAVTDISDLGERVYFHSDGGESEIEHSRAVLLLSSERKKCTKHMRAAWVSEAKSFELTFVLHLYGAVEGEVTNMNLCRTGPRLEVHAAENLPTSHRFSLELHPTGGKASDGRKMIEVVLEKINDMLFQDVRYRLLFSDTTIAVENMRGGRVASLPLCEEAHLSEKLAEAIQVRAEELTVLQPLPGFPRQAVHRPKRLACVGLLNPLLPTSPEVMLTGARELDVVMDCKNMEFFVAVLDQRHVPPDLQKGIAHNEDAIMQRDMQLHDLLVTNVVDRYVELERARSTKALRGLCRWTRSSRYAEAAAGNPRKAQRTLDALKDIDKELHRRLTDICQGALNGAGICPWNVVLNAISWGIDKVSRSHEEKIFLNYSTSAHGSDTENTSQHSAESSSEGEPNSDDKDYEGLPFDDDDDEPFALPGSASDVADEDTTGESTDSDHELAAALDEDPVVELAPLSTGNAKREESAAMCEYRDLLDEHMRSKGLPQNLQPCEIDDMLSKCREDTLYDQARQYQRNDDGSRAHRKKFWERCAAVIPTQVTQPCIEMRNFASCPRLSFFQELNVLEEWLADAYERRGPVTPESDRP